MAASRINGESFAIKAINKRWILQSNNNIQSVWRERDVMTQVRSNFLVPAAYTFQDAENVYLVMKLMPGGDLRWLLYQSSPLPESMNEESLIGDPLSEDQVRFYLVEILFGLEELHSFGIVYRSQTQKENRTIYHHDVCILTLRLVFYLYNQLACCTAVLLDEQGHVSLSDFGPVASSDIASAEHEAQESLYNSLNDFAPDVYSFGVVMYELLHGSVPGPYEDPRQLRFHSKLSSACLALLIHLLQHDPNARIGYDPQQRAHRWTYVKEHPFFAKVNWNRAHQKSLQPPIKPVADTVNCDPVYELVDQLLENPAVQLPPLSEREQTVFKGWEYHTDPMYHSKEFVFKPSERSILSLSSNTNSFVEAPAPHLQPSYSSNTTALADNKVGAPKGVFIQVQPSSETARENDDSKSSIVSNHLSEEEEEIERISLAAVAAMCLLNLRHVQSRNSTLQLEQVGSG